MYAFPNVGPIVMFWLVSFQLPILLDLGQNRTDAVGIAGRIAIIEYVLSEREPAGTEQ